MRSSLTSSSTSTLIVTVLSGCSPRAYGHQSSGLSMPNAHSTLLAPLPSERSKSRSTRSSTRVRMRTARGPALSSVTLTTMTARCSSASRQMTRHVSMRTGPLRSMRTGRHNPPGFHVGSMQSQCWNTPVILRLAVRSAGGVHVTSTASTCSGERRAGRICRRRAGRSSLPDRRGRHRRAIHHLGRRAHRARPRASAGRAGLEFEVRAVDEGAVGAGKD